MGLHEANISSKSTIKSPDQERCFRAFILDFVQVSAHTCLLQNSLVGESISSKPWSSSVAFLISIPFSISIPFPIPITMAVSISITIFRPWPWPFISFCIPFSPANIKHLLSELYCLLFHFYIVSYHIIQGYLSHNRHSVCHKSLILLETGISWKIIQNHIEWKEPVIYIVNFTLLIFRLLHVLLKPHFDNRNCHVDCNKPKLDDLDWWTLGRNHPDVLHVLDQSQFGLVQNMHFQDFGRHEENYKPFHEDIISCQKVL